MKGLTTLLFTASMLLTACNKNGIAGKYGFQMGKEQGTHFGIFLELKNNYVTLDSEPDVTNKYKECIYSFTIKQGGDGESESVTSLVELIGIFLGQESKDIITVPGYYYQGSHIGKSKEFELKMGIDFKFLKERLDNLDDNDDLEFPVLSPDTVEKIVYTKYAKDMVTMYIPVSEQDIIFQLYWYGIDITYNETDGLDFDTTLPAHPVGSHPTKEEVAEINQTYGAAHTELSNVLGIDLSSYRDYYTLAMGLIKQ